MSPPYQDRQETLELVRGGLEPPTPSWPSPCKYAYSALGVGYLWQLVSVQLPIVPTARYELKISVQVVGTVRLPESSPPPFASAPPPESLASPDRPVEENSGLGGGELAVPP